MAAVDNLRLNGAQAQLDAHASRADRQALAFGLVQREFYAALRRGPDTRVSLPDDTMRTVAEVVAAIVVDAEDVQVLADLLAIAHLAAEHDDTPAGAAARDFMRLLAHAHADAFVSAMTALGAFDD